MKIIPLLTLGLFLVAGWLPAAAQNNWPPEVFMQGRGKVTIYEPQPEQSGKQQGRRCQPACRLAKGGPI